MELSDLLKTLLDKRGISDIESFLNPDYSSLHDPMLLPDMGKALARFLAAMERNERIAIYTDFDCDGVSAATVFSDFLEKIGYTNAEIYMPHRDNEGYGFHEQAIRELHSRGTSLIITADVGIAAAKEVRVANELGVDVIITDHHEVMNEMPRAYAIVNPKLSGLALSGVEGYPFPHLCGAAVAYKFVQAALKEGRERGLEQFLKIPEGWEKWLLDVVAIATVADMVPLVGENRVLVHYGLRVLRRTRRPGLAALAQATRLRLTEITEDDIGFSIAPRINAASRMDNPDLALKLLTTQDPLEANRLAEQLEQLNTKRKTTVATIVRSAKKRARERFAEDSPVTVLGDSAWKPALLGLAANSLMNDRGGVVCLWGRDAAGNLKGSCRSDGAVSLSDLFQSAPDAFLQFGGHAHAGGFTVSSEQVHTLHEALMRAVANFQSATAPSIVEGLSHDISVPLSTVSNSLIKEISLLSPFGMGNPKPIFHIPEARITGVRAFGKEKNHVEVMLECATTGRIVRAFEFFKQPASFTFLPAAGTSADLLATVERDSYRGPAAVSLRIVDFLPVC
ncbi:MAG TPA: single-stranded-DNA-specific exonuclease RecJ [Candidatus Paceibacterota bacterium]